VSNLHPEVNPANPNLEHIFVVDVATRSWMRTGKRMASDASNRSIPFWISSPPSTGPHRLSRPSRVITCLSIFYPALIYFGIRYSSPQVLALVLALLVLGRRTSAFGVRTSPWCVAGGVLLAVFAFGLKNALPLKMYPVLVNAGLLAVFVSSLRNPPTIAERIARLRTPNLPQFAVVYTRRVTQVWCVFFVGNGLVALWTALWSPDHAWLIYNGVIAYVLVGALFGGEWLVRQLVLPRSDG
jgi:uncharacterized membrane protein